MTEQALFYGVVHPMGDGWSFDEPFKVTFVDLEVKAEFFIKAGKFTAIAFGEKEFDSSFSNALVAVMQGVLDAIGFHLGASMRVELFGGFASPATVIFVTPHSWPEAAGRTDSDPKRVDADTLVPYTRAAMNEPLVRFALADICAAFVEPDDTGFLCYRAVESIRQWYKDRNPTTEEPSVGWSRLRDALGFDENELKQLRDLARRRRHGAAAVITEADRLWAIDLARRVVAAFVAALPPAEVTDD